MRSKAMISMSLMLMMFLASNYVMAKHVKVTFTQSVVVGEKTLEPGEYIFKEISPRVVQVFTNNDEMQVEAAVITIDTQDKQTADETKVVLSKFEGSNNYYIDKMWIEGKATGYEFTMPEKLKSLQKEREESIAGKYEEVDDDEEGLK